MEAFANVGGGSNPPPYGWALVPAKQGIGPSAKLTLVDDCDEEICLGNVLGSGAEPGLNLRSVRFLPFSSLSGILDWLIEAVSI